MELKFKAYVKRFDKVVEIDHIDFKNKIVYSSSPGQMLECKFDEVELIMDPSYESMKLKSLLKTIPGCTHIEIRTKFKFTLIADFNKNDDPSIWEYVVEKYGDQEVITTSSTKNNTIAILINQLETNEETNKLGR